MGWASDNYGRKKVLFVSLGLVLVCNLLIPFMPNIYLFIVLRFITGLSFPGATNQMGNILCEMVASRYRPLARIGIWIFDSLSACLLSLNAYYIKSWRTLFLVCTAPYLFIMLFYKFTPESPRWLRLRGKTDEMMHTLERVARFNGRRMPLNLHILPVDDEVKNKSSNPLHLFRTLKISVVSLILGIDFFILGLVYYSIHMTAGELGGSIYLNITLLSLAEIPASVMAIFLCNRFGRKYPTLFCITLSGVSCLIIAFLSPTQELFRIISGLIGMLSITICLGTLDTWSFELYPTIVRGQATGYTIMAATTGMAASPWLISGLEKIHHSAPFICMAVVAFICAVTFLFLSETKGKPTLETMEDLSNNKHLLDKVESNVEN